MKKYLPAILTVLVVAYSISPILFFSLLLAYAPNKNIKLIQDKFKPIKKK